MARLNLGAGTSLIDECDNVDIDPQSGAELHFDITQPFPLGDQSYDEIYIFHTIEHIEKRHHAALFAEIRRVLKDDGRLLISYPEFSKIAYNWAVNKNNERHFWECTIYGRQSSPSDFHVCAMDTLDFKQFLADRGFTVGKAIPEPIDDFNTILEVKKAELSITYENLLHNELFAK